MMNQCNESKKGMLRLRIILPFIIFIFVLVIMYKQIHKPSTEKLSLGMMGKPFPQFALPDLNSEKTVLTKKDITGTPALINIWASKCFDCKIEASLLSELMKEKVPIYGINYKDSRKDALSWLKKYGNPFTHSISDKEGTLTAILNVTDLPETFLVDADGIIRFQYAGSLDDRVWSDVLLPKYKSLLRQSEQGKSYNNMQIHSLDKVK